MKYLFWSIRRKLSRLFYKKWFFSANIDGKEFRSCEFDPEKEKLVIKKGKVSLKPNDHQD